jgi:hypothetical protein
MLYAANDAYVALQIYRAWTHAGSLALTGKRKGEEAPIA